MSDITCEPFDSDVLSGFGAVVAKYAPNLDGKPLNFQVLNVTSNGFGSAKWELEGTTQKGCFMTFKLTLGAPVSDEDYQIMTDEMIKKQAESMAMRFMAAMGDDDGLH